MASKYLPTAVDTTCERTCKECTFQRLCLGDMNVFELGLGDIALKRVAIFLGFIAIHNIYLNILKSTQP